MEVDSFELQEVLNHAFKKGKHSTDISVRHSCH